MDREGWERRDGGSGTYLTLASISHGSIDRGDRPPMDYEEKRGILVGWSKQPGSAEEGEAAAESKRQKRRRRRRRRPQQAT